MSKLTVACFGQTCRLVRILRTDNLILVDKTAIATFSLTLFLHKNTNLWKNIYYICTGAFSLPWLSPLCEIGCGRVCVCVSFQCGGLDGETLYLTVESIKIQLSTLRFHLRVEGVFSGFTYPLFLSSHLSAPFSPCSLIWNMALVTSTHTFMDSLLNPITFFLPK